MSSHWLQVMFSNKLVNDMAEFATVFLWIIKSSLRMYLR